MANYDFLMDNGMFGIDPSIPAVSSDSNLDSQNVQLERTVHKGKSEFAKDIRFEKQNNKAGKTISKSSKSNDREIVVIHEYEDNMDKEI